MYVVLCYRNIVVFDCGFHNEILLKQLGIEKSHSVKMASTNKTSVSGYEVQI